MAMSDTAIIPRRSLHDELAAQLRDMLMRGDLKAGDKISEQALCQRFGVSRTPLREALKVLANEGLVILSPNRGASVARVSPDEVDELFPIMGAMEALAGEAACARATDADIAAVQALHDEMLVHYRASDPAAYLRLNRRIHEAFFDMAGNTALSQLYQTLMVRIHAVRFVAQKSSDRWREAVEDHEEMMAALRARDGARLGTILKLHLRHKAAMVHESLVDLARAAE
ncbi:GntR family transcriptional regulator [Ancylobacter vacuolatus]|uniref:DNA-binding GntR family transcriptional regulator n=1 Tax=Ancylobacter vacuolatus TaxID=223389 RepID=A0ABU0DIJ6_9HYPH|nr:GntR family transcriptional regulator [Ancylobacter vacuolatus]MDQ0348245.1 DNA-binding GntR family transcriptional regulator [Ancylobacter vacuolatus]